MFHQRQENRLSIFTKLMPAAPYRASSEFLIEDDSYARSRLQGIMEQAKTESFQVSDISTKQIQDYTVVKNYLSMTISLGTNHNNNHLALFLTKCGFDESAEQVRELNAASIRTWNGRSYQAISAVRLGRYP